ncbi:MAG: sensor histidine kinase [Acidimicrobiia bacterium]
MEWILAIAGLIVVAALVALGVVVSRFRASEAIVEAVGASLGDADRDGDVVSDVRAVVRRAHTAEVAANQRGEVLRRAPVGVVVVSSGGSVSFENDVAHVMLAEVEGGAILRTRILGLARSVLASRAVESIEVDVHEPERKVLSMTASPLHGVDGMSDACVYLEDRTEQRRLDAVRTDFVANASHELKTPLGGLSLLAETLMDAEDEIARARLSDQIRREAQRMALVVDDVIRLAETEALGADHRQLDLAEVVAGAVDLVRDLASQSHISLVNRGLAGALVFGDRAQLMSAVTNLLDNAIAYTAIKNEPGVVEYGLDRDDGHACISVADSGIGIPTRYEGRVFERFFRVDRARSRESGGTGLGLSIVRNVAVAHGGSVSVASKVGVGSTFIIRIPLVQGDT